MQRSSSCIRERKKYFRPFIQLFQNKDVDYTKININKSVILLAVPMVFEMLMESAFALVDLYFVGHLKESAFAMQTVGLTESMLMIVYAFSIGMGMAVTAIVSRRVGEKNTSEAVHSGVQAVMLSCVITMILCLTGISYAKNILLLMGASEESAVYGTPFTQIMMGSGIVIVLLTLFNSIFRGAGNALIAMKSLWLATIVNIILCPLFIQGWFGFPAMGLTGAAVATTIGRIAGVLYQLYYIKFGNGSLKFSKKYFSIDWDIIRSLLRIAGPGIFQFVIASGSWIILTRLVAVTGGDEGSAGYQTAMRLIAFFMLPAIGLSNTAATLVGQNLGAGEAQRAEFSVMRTVSFSILYMIGVSLLFVLLNDLLISFFTNEGSVKMIAKSAMNILAVGFIFYGIGMVIMNAFNGSGDTWTPTWIYLFGFWLFQIPLAYLLAKYFALGEKGVFIAIAISQSITSVVAFIFFKRGKWKLKKV
jgi:putative MATE family efflux protein